MRWGIWVWKEIYGGELKGKGFDVILNIDEERKHREEENAL